MSFSEWNTVRLQDVVSKLGDGLHGTPKYDEYGEYFFINGNNLVEGKIIIKESTKKVCLDEYNKYKKELNNRTILLGINGTIGNVALYNGEKCILGKSACYFNVIESVNKHFIKYVVESDSFQNYIQNFANGTTIKNVSLKSVREFEFKLPIIEIQERIASILSSLDDKIELNRQTNQTLEAIAQTLFKEMCLPKGDELPEGWRVGKFLDVAEQVKSSVNPSASPLKLFNHYSLPAFDVNQVPAFDLGETILSNKTVVKSYSVLFSKLNPRIPRIWSIGSIDESISIGSTEFIGFVPKKSFQYSFINFFLKQTETINTLTGHATGTSTSHQRVKPSDILDLPLSIPSDNTLVKYDGIVRPLLEQRFRNIEEIKTLTIIRDSLLPKLMKGEIIIGNTAL